MTSTDQILRALADGTRREIVHLVAAREHSAGEIAARFPMTRQAVSQHLGILLSSGLVSVQEAGTRRLYRADPAAAQHVRDVFERLWDESLIRLKIAAETAEENP